MTEDVIEHYYTFNTKGCKDEHISGNFIDQPIPPNYYYFLNDNNEYGNIIIGTPVDDVLPKKQEVQYSYASNG